MYDPHDPDRPNVLAGLRIDRAGRHRRDPDWIAARAAAPEARSVLIWRDQTIVAPTAGGMTMALLAELGRLIDAAGDLLEDPPVFLGDMDGRPVFAVDVTRVEDLPGLIGRLPMDDPAMEAAAAIPIDLRQAAATLDPQQAALVAYGRAMAYWHSRHRFCGVCGAPTRSEQGGHVRRCTGCGADHFPRTDPAVIMLAHKDDWCVLGRQPRFPAGMYSTLAGFVEPGESLEECVRREIAEEVGLKIGKVTYRHSQPWPFPASLMVGFRAEILEGGPLDVDRHELEDAIWVQRDELKDPELSPVSLPNRISIARRLIDEWLAEG
ncbi:NAD(+) diphosphatase [Tistrella mobilis]|jgi:NAD+ diphosphatase|uniref:NAD(+) diphosphatase n=1 Tax=Tistrella mobilis TaxID=171437 RepID=UPI00355671C1